MRKSKRLLGLTLALAIIASMFTGIIPVSAATTHQNFDGADYANNIVAIDDFERVDSTSGEIRGSFNSTNSPVFVPYSNKYKDGETLRRYFYVKDGILGYRADDNGKNGAEGVFITNPIYNNGKNYRINVAVNYKAYTAYAYIGLDGVLDSVGGQYRKWFPNGTKTSLNSDIPKNKWIRHTFDFISTDKANNKYTVNWYMDGELKGSVDTINYYLHYIHFSTAPYTTTQVNGYTNEILFDDFYACELSDNLMVTPNIEDGAAEVPLSKDFTFKFTGDVSSDGSMDAIKLMKGSEEIAVTSKTYDAKTNTVTASVSGLEPYTDYRWDLSGVKDVTGVGFAGDKVYNFKTVKSVTYASEDFATPGDGLPYTGTSGKLSVKQSLAQTENDYVKIENGTMHYHYSAESLAARREPKLNYDLTAALGEGKYRMEFDFKSYATFGFHIYDSKTSWSYGHFSPGTLGSYNDNKWHRIAMDITSAKDNLSAKVYIDGEYKNTVTSGTGWDGKIKRLEIDLTIYASNDPVNTDAYFDNLVIKTIPVDFEMTDSSLLHIDNSASLSLEPKLTFGFSDCVSSTGRTPVVSLKGSDEPLELQPTVSYMANERKLTLDFADCNLSKNTDYVIDIGTVKSIENFALAEADTKKYEFGTGDDDTITYVREAVKEDGTAAAAGATYGNGAVNATVTLRNMGHGKNVVYAIARYTGGTLDELKLVEVKVPGDGTDFEIPCEAMTAPAAAVDYSIKTFVWLDDLTPLNSAPFELK